MMGSPSSSAELAGVIDRAALKRARERASSKIRRVMRMPHTRHAHAASDLRGLILLGAGSIVFPVTRQGAVKMPPGRP